MSVIKMKIKSTHILEQIQHKNRTILCQIRVQPRKIQYVYGHPGIETSRWLQVEHWAGIDAGLEKILEKFNDFQETDEERFQLTSSIAVRVRKSNISIRKLCQYINDIELKEKDVHLALECSIIWLDDKLKNIGDTFSKFKDLFMETEDHEYTPEFNASSYETYTASPVKDTSGTPVAGLSTPNIEDEYSPQPVHDKIHKLTPAPAYNAARIKTRRMKATEQVTSVLHSAKKPDDLMKDETVKEKSHKREGEQAKGKRREKVEKTKQKKAQSDGDDEPPFIHLEPLIQLEIVDSEETEMPKQTNDADDDATASVKKNTHKSANNEFSSPESIRQDGKPRRSSRSPVKPHRLIEEKVESIKHLKSSSSTKLSKSHKNTHDRDLFGSSEDEDFVKTTPKPSTSKRLDSPMVSASKNKRKRAQTFECDRSKSGMDKWLGKKKSAVATLLPNSGSSLDGRKNKTSSADRSNGKKKRTPSASTPPSSAPFVPLPPVYPTIQEMQEQMKREKVQMEENARVREYLEKLIPPTPEKVEMWSLNDMSAEEIRDTFPQYKPVLDDVFRKYCKKSNVRNHNGADHFLVMNILEHSKQLEMMNKLRDVYENDGEGTSMYLQLFANAMMPEWIICIFMDRHNYTRDQAMERMAAQDKYRLYLKEGQSDSSFYSP